MSPAASLAPKGPGGIGSSSYGRLSVSLNAPPLEIPDSPRSDHSEEPGPGPGPGPQPAANSGNLGGGAGKVWAAPVPTPHSNASANGGAGDGGKQWAAPAGQTPHPHANGAQPRPWEYAGHTPHPAKAAGRPAKPWEAQPVERDATDGKRQEPPDPDAPERKEVFRYKQHRPADSDDEEEAPGGGVRKLLASLFCLPHVKVKRLERQDSIVSTDYVEEWQKAQDADTSARPILKKEGTTGFELAGGSDGAAAGPAGALPAPPSFSLAPSGSLAASNATATAVATITAMASASPFNSGGAGGSPGGGPAGAPGLVGAPGAPLQPPEPGNTVYLAAPPPGSTELPQVQWHLDLVTERVLPLEPSCTGDLSARGSPAPGGLAASAQAGQSQSAQLQAQLQASGGQLLESVLAEHNRLTGGAGSGSLSGGGGWGGGGGPSTHGGAGGVSVHGGGASAYGHSRPQSKRSVRWN